VVAHLIPVRPINTADHFTLMMDHEIRQSGLAGNFCGLVFHLSEQPNAGMLGQKVDAFVQRFPDVQVRLSRQGRHYVWSQCPAESGDHFFRYSAGDREQAMAVIRGIINRDEAVASAIPVGFHLVEMPGCAYLVLRWFHPLCDARGAELIMHHLLNDEDVDDAVDPFFEQQQRWGLWRKFRMMVQAKRHIAVLDQTENCLPVSRDAAADELDFHIERLDAETSATILKQARKDAGMTGTALYFIGCMMRAMDRSGCNDGEGFCVPYAMNMRKSKALYPLFGNQVSFLFAQAGLEQVRDRKELFATLREQHKQTVRSGLDVALVPLMQAGSWLPLEKYGRIIRNTPSGSERSSFWFSYTGEPTSRTQSIAGAPVETMFQLSQVTSPPSLALLVSLLDGRITLSFNYIASQIDKGWLMSLVEAVKFELQGEA